MKMAKKFLAVALAGVLALSVLTGCGDSTNTKSIAEAMSDMGQVMGLTFKEDTELNPKAKAIVEELVNADATELDHKGLTDPQKAKIMDIMGSSYSNQFVCISATETKGNSATAQAVNLLANMMYVHTPDGENIESAKTWYIGTTTFTKNGTTYRFAVITIEAQASDDGGNTDQGNTKKQ